MIGRLGEGDRETTDDKPDRGKDNERPGRRQAVRAAGDTEDDEGHDRDGNRKQDRPAEVHDVRPLERRQVEDRNRDRALAEPGPAPQPDPHERPDGRCKQPRHEDHRQPRAAHTRRLDQDQRRKDGGPEQERDGGERRRDGHQFLRLLRRVGPHQADGEKPERSAHGDQGRLGTEHKPEADRRHPRQDDLRQRYRLSGGGAEAVRGNVTAIAGQAVDREGDEHARDRKHRQRPPQRCAVEPDRVGEVGVDPPLHVEDELEEPPRHRGYDDAHESRQDEQRAKLPAEQGRRGVGRGRGIGGHARRAYPAGSASRL